MEFVSARESACDRSQSGATGEHDQAVLGHKTAPDLPSTGLLEHHDADQALNYRLVSFNGSSSSFLGEALGRLARRADE